MNGKAVTKQTFAILPKIREVDGLLQMRPELREVVREVHPEVCFSELAGVSMTHHKASTLGREERQRALALSFPQLHMIEKAGREQGLPMEDILDATVACWSAIRLAGGNGRSLPDVVAPARSVKAHRRVNYSMYGWGNVRSSDRPKVSEMLAGPSHGEFRQCLS